MKTKNNAYKVKLGIFVSLGLLFLFIIIFFIGNNQNLFSSKFRVHTNFSNVSGLQVGGQVRFSGISIGTIEDIVIINDTTVRVSSIINNDVKKFIKFDSKASIASEGVIGDRILTISQGSAKAQVIKDGATIKSFEPVEFGDILASLQVTAGNAEIITSELALLLGDINNGEGTIGRLMNDDGMAEDLDKTMENLRKSTKGLEQNMEAAKSNFLLRGYFKKKEKEKIKEQKRLEKEAEKEAERKAKEAEKKKE